MLETKQKRQNKFFMELTESVMDTLPLMCYNFKEKYF